MRFAACFVGLIISFSAFAESGRSLPSGVNPLVITRVFQSRNGEVHVLKAPTGQLSAVLRANTGGLAQLEEVIGSARCNEWLQNNAENKADSMNASCTLLFRRDVDHALVRVDARELEQGSLFSLVRATLKGRHGAF